jgi:hypothetical protein
LCERREEKGRE